MPIPCKFCCFLHDDADVGKASEDKLFRVIDCTTRPVGVNRFHKRVPVTEDKMYFCNRQCYEKFHELPAVVAEGADAEAEEDYWKFERWYQDFTNKVDGPSRN